MECLDVGWSFEVASCDPREDKILSQYIFYVESAVESVTDGPVRQHVFRDVECRVERAGHQNG
jgi:hypothetical protein